jgi:site-specific recombinase XerD
MNGTPLFEVTKLLRHASVQMTERYAHLAPDHLHDAVARIGFSAH